MQIINPFDNEGRRETSQFVKHENLKAQTWNVWLLHNQNMKQIYVISYYRSTVPDLSW